MASSQRHEPKLGKPPEGKQEFLCENFRQGRITLGGWDLRRLRPGRVIRRTLTLGVSVPLGTIDLVRRGAGLLRFVQVVVG